MAGCLKAATVVAVLLAGLSLVEGTKCGTERYECGDGASCSASTNKCECNQGYKGLPLFLCKPQEYKVCQIVGDPIGKSFPEEHPVKYSLPCKNLMTSMSVERKNYRNGQLLTCTMKVFSTQKRINGRTAVHGYEFELDWYTFKDRKAKFGKFFFRQTGKLVGGNYEYTSLSRNADGEVWVETDFSKITNDLNPDQPVTWKETNSTTAYYSVFSVPPCSFEVFFRPSNQDDAFASEFMPGLSINQYYPGDDFVNTWRKDRTFCRSLNPAEYNVSQAMAESGTDATGLFMIDTMDSAPDQDFPDVSDSCTTLSEKVNSMKAEDKASLIRSEKSCRFIFYKPDFVDCFAKGEDSDNLVSLYADCLDVFFQPTLDCSDLLDTINTSGCASQSSLSCGPRK